MSAYLRGLADKAKWITPPQNQGQIVVTSYAEANGMILERTYDRSTGRITDVAYRHPVRGEFEPWQSVPKLGRRVGIIKQEANR